MEAVTQKTWEIHQQKKRDVNFTDKDTAKIGDVADRKKHCGITKKKHQTQTWWFAKNVITESNGLISNTLIIFKFN